MTSACSDAASKSHLGNRRHQSLFALSPHLRFALGDDVAAA